MHVLFDAYIAIRDFLELGGPVLNVISGTIFVMWIVIVERTMYGRSVLVEEAMAAQRKWHELEERTANTPRKERIWYAQLVRGQIMAHFRNAANGGIPLIKTLVAICPLLGLMGTVTGMIDVFEVLAISGTGNVRSMATGVSRATIPTMAGMVGALTGMLAVTLLARHAEREIERLEESLTLDQ